MVVQFYNIIVVSGLKAAHMTQGLIRKAGNPQCLRIREVIDYQEKAAPR